MATKKLGVIQKLFGSKKLSIEDDDTEEALDDANVILQEFKRCSYSRRHTVDVETFRGEMTDEALMAAATAKYSGMGFGGKPKSSYENVADGDKNPQRPVIRVSSDKANLSSDRKPLDDRKPLSDRKPADDRKLLSDRKPLNDRKPPAPVKSSGGRRVEPSTSGGSSSGSGSSGSGGHSTSGDAAAKATPAGRQRRTGVYMTAAAAKGAMSANAAKNASTSPTSSALPTAVAAPPPKAIRTLLGTPSGRHGGGSFKRRSVRKERRACSTGQKVDTTRPLMFPTTPETILEYHKSRPFLDENEEWLLVELNEYECLVDSLAIIKIIAKHSKFFEVEPAELWEEFFEFVDDVPSYDEVINFDVWQEFRDKKYTC
jgi:hypothetical protein